MNNESLKSLTNEQQNKIVEASSVNFDIDNINTISMKFTMMNRYLSKENDELSLGREYFLLSMPTTTNKEITKELLKFADIYETVSIYKAIHLYKNAEEFTDIMAAGLRHNNIYIFESIALNNHFSAKYFDDEAWNQMILKAVFNDCDLDCIINIENRKNKTLIQMLSDFVIERKKASREVSKQLIDFINIKE